VGQGSSSGPSEYDVYVSYITLTYGLCLCQVCPGHVHDNRSYLDRYSGVWNLSC